MKKNFIKKIIKTSTIIFIGLNLINGTYCKSEEIINNAARSKDILKGVKDNNLIPMPIGDFDFASKKVNTKRNPFQDPSKSEITNINSFNQAIKFKGIAESEDKLVAIIEINNEQKFYQLGDILENGFKIKAISFEDITVDISNGFKNYRLTLNKLNKSS